LLAAVTAEGMEDVAGQALGVDADDRGRRVDVTHDKGNGGFSADSGRRDVVVAGCGVFDQALESEDAELSPPGGEVGFGHFGHACKRHVLIIRFGAHKH
jgi:hypothetical protein